MIKGNKENRGGTAALRYAGFIAGRRSKWIVLALWALLIAVGGSLASELGSVQNNEQQTWLPAHAQSTRAIKVAEQHFAEKDISNAVVVYSRESAGGLTTADVTKVNDDLKRFGRPDATAVFSHDHKAAYISVPV